MSIMIENLRMSRRETGRQAIIDFGRSQEKREGEKERKRGSREAEKDTRKAFDNKNEIKSEIKVRLKIERRSVSQNDIRRQKENEESSTRNRNRGKRKEKCHIKDPGIKEEVEEIDSFE